MGGEKRGAALSGQAARLAALIHEVLQPQKTPTTFLSRPRPPWVVTTDLTTGYCRCQGLAGLIGQLSVSPSLSEPHHGTCRRWTD